MNTMNIVEVLDYLPHRYPLMLVDRVLECVPGESLVALKNVTFNEPFFLGHFPHRPIMPGVLILEALAQATGILAFKTVEKMPESGLMYYLAGIDRARFKKPVEPGDQLRLEVKFLKASRNIWKFEGQARVDGKLAAAASFMCAAVEQSKEGVQND